MVISTGSLASSAMTAQEFDVGCGGGGGGVSTVGGGVCLRESSG